MGLSSVLINLLVSGRGSDDGLVALVGGKVHSEVLAGGVVQHSFIICLYSRRFLKKDILQLKIIKICINLVTSI